MFLWFRMSIGNAVPVSLCCMEYFVRIDSPVVSDDFWIVLFPEGRVPLSEKL